MKSETTRSEIALDMAYREGKIVKADSSGLSFWVDKGTADRVRGYAKSLGLTNSELVRNIFLANVPTDDEVSAQLKQYGQKER